MSGWGGMEKVYVVVVTGRQPDNQNVLATVAAYVTDEPARAVELMEQAERETGGTACINLAPYQHVPDSACFFAT